MIRRAITALFDAAHWVVDVAYFHTLDSHDYINRIRRGERT